MISNIFSLADNILVVVFALLFSRIIGTVGIWAAYPMAEITALLIIIVYLWKESKKFPSSASDFAGTRTGFEVSEDDMLSIEVRTMDEVVKVSECIMQFCKEKHTPSKTGFFAGLAIEEMAGNIVRYGFEDGKKHEISIFVIKEKDNLTIRVKDNCKAFDPIHYMEQFSDDDSIKNIGIKLVENTAKDMKYQRILDLNYLTICL
ncbi:MAG: hypothetical protein GX677_04910 [Treponema sp.]|jgi:anti-sigma regulatory factor (Ser/Thr protein kinase)|nr:hypothetical protein [Treponema sp.]